MTILNVSDELRFSSENCSPNEQLAYAVDRFLEIQRGGNPITNAIFAFRLITGLRCDGVVDSSIDSELAQKAKMVGYSTIVLIEESHPELTLYKVASAIGACLGLLFPDDDGLHSDRYDLACHFTAELEALYYKSRLQQRGNRLHRLAALRSAASATLNPDAALN